MVQDLKIIQGVQSSLLLCALLRGTSIASFLFIYPEVLDSSKSNCMHIYTHSYYINIYVRATYILCILLLSLNQFWR